MAGHGVALPQLPPGLSITLSRVGPSGREFCHVRSRRGFGRGAAM